MSKPVNTPSAINVSTFQKCFLFELVLRMVPHLRPATYMMRRHKKRKTSKNLRNIDSVKLLPSVKGRGWEGARNVYVSRIMLAGFFSSK